MPKRAICAVVGAALLFCGAAANASGYALPTVAGGAWSCGGAGYNCASASDAFGGGGASGTALTHTYACVDWSVGSRLWANQECAYAARTGAAAAAAPVFGVGSFGTPADGAMGKCYEMTVEGMARPLIAQVVNTGSDVHAGQFDLQQMAGGMGLCNALTSSRDGFSDQSAQGSAAFPMFAGDNTPWGPNNLGGFSTSAGCAGIPALPDGAAVAQANGGAPLTAFPNGELDLRALCTAAFTLGARVEGGANPRITRGHRVACPAEIYHVTGLRLLSDDALAPGDTTAEAFTDGGVTRMFDGCKPSSGWLGNVGGADPAFPATVGCGPDGVTRTATPFAGPALAACVSSPTPSPTPTPTTPTPTPSLLPEGASCQADGDCQRNACVSGTCDASANLQGGNHDGDGSDGAGRTAIVVVAVAAGVAAAVAAAVACCYCARRRKGSSAPEGLDGESSATRRLTGTDIEAQAVVE